MIFKGSRYARGTAYVDLKTDITYLAPADTYIKEHKTDLLYKVEPGDRLDLLAYKFYGNSRYSWILLCANPNYYSELDLQAGDYLVVPTKERALQYVNGS